MKTVISLVIAALTVSLVGGVAALRSDIGNHRAVASSLGMGPKVGSDIGNDRIGNHGTGPRVGAV